MPVELIFPSGFTGGAIAAGLKKSGKPDLGIIRSDVPCEAIGVFTQNSIRGANIELCEAAVDGSHKVCGIIVHSGQANVCTGAEGDEVANQTLEAVAKATNTSPEEWVLGSTGVIGVLPDVTKLTRGIDNVCASGFDQDGLEKVSEAMMTTDLTPKVVSRQIEIGGKKVTITGFAKGSGMIHPNMATMLAYIMTDAVIDRSNLDTTFRDAVEKSFNCLSVDGDTSTSDMAVILANGSAGNEAIDWDKPSYEKWSRALEEVCTGLAKKIAIDGEGATKLITINVTGTIGFEVSKQIAMSVACSSLVKTAVCGCDPNWGRIAAAVGYSGAEIHPEELEINLMKTPIFKSGEPVVFDNRDLSDKMKNSREIIIDIKAGNGSSEATVWTCDLTSEYVRINSEYTT